MRRERQDNPLIESDEKQKIRFLQIENCQEEASKINLRTLPLETREAYKGILDLQKAGVDFSDPKVRYEYRLLISYAAPMLQYGKTTAYLDRVFERLKAKSAINVSDSFSLTEIESSPDSSNKEESAKVLGWFEGNEDADLILLNSSSIYGMTIFLNSVGLIEKPIFPSLRRDLAARTGYLYDLIGSNGGAKQVLNTSILGVCVVSEYKTGQTEFPDLRVSVAKLR